MSRYGTHESRMHGWAAGLALAAGLLACSPSGTDLHQVRGQVVAVADGGRALEVDHEAIPDTMEAMRMTIPLLDPAAAPELAPGDKIRFELYLSRGTGRIGAIEKLPASTSLELAPQPHTPRKPAKSY